MLVRLLIMQARCPRSASWWATLRRPMSAAPAGIHCAAVMWVLASGGSVVVRPPPPPLRQVRCVWPCCACHAVAQSGCYVQLCCGPSPANRFVVHAMVLERQCRVLNLGWPLCPELPPIARPAAAHLAAAAEDNARATAASSPSAQEPTAEASVRVPAAGAAGARAQCPAYR